MGLMSAIVSLSPSLRNHSHDFFWMSMRLGSGRGWSSLANDVRTRGACGSFKRVSSVYCGPGKKSTPHQRNRGMAAGNARPKNLPQHEAQCKQQIPAAAPSACPRMGGVKRPEGRSAASGPGHERKGRGASAAPRPFRVSRTVEALYLISTVAPASSSCFLASSASSLVTPSLIAFGSALDDVLGLLEAKTGERAHDLDDLDLLVAEGGEHDVELRSAPRPGRRRRRRQPEPRPWRPGRRGADAELFLERLDHLAELEHGHALDGLDQLVLGKSCLPLSVHLTWGLKALLDRVVRLRLTPRRRRRAAAPPDRGHGRSR